jgi:peptidoglycan/LPS O-acetylase OafA/YrhL
MGLLRVLLALSVLLDHAHGLGGYAMIGGPLAVQCFFIVSGFYMGLVLNERYDRPALNRTFWINRALRIFGVYYLFLALYLVIFAAMWAGTGSSPLDPYLNSTLPFWNKAGLALLNLTVIGLDLPIWLAEHGGHLVLASQFAGTGGGEVFHFTVIPAAWSISLELCFYLIAPFIVRRPARQVAVLAALSLLLRAGAAQYGLFSDPFSARFFPFELALFLAGVLAYRAWATYRQMWAKPLARVMALAVPAALLAWPWWHGDWPIDLFFTPPRVALLSLFALALPAIHEWSQKSTTDRAMGELSYPFYLGHLLVLGLISGVPQVMNSPIATVLLAAAITLALSWLVVRLVERPIEALRRRIAQRAGAAA